MSGEGYLASERSLVEGVGRGDFKMAQGQVTPAAASETVVTGLNYVLAVVASLDGDPGTGAGDTAHVSASIGDQAGTPAAGSVLLKSWQDDITAASSFAKANWIAIGY